VIVVEIKKLLYLVWAACGIGIIALLLIHFFIVTIASFYFYSTLVLFIEVYPLFASEAQNTIFFKKYQKSIQGKVI
jgi:hypothetical protein